MKTLMIVTGYALFWTGLIYVIIMGRVENAWIYSVIVFVLAWLGGATIIGFIQAAGEQDRINEMMEKKLREGNQEPDYRKEMS